MLKVKVKLRKFYINNNCFSVFSDDAGNRCYMIIGRKKKVYVIPFDNIFVQFPNKIYRKGEVKGEFYRFEKISDTKFYGVYKTKEGTQFTVNKRLKTIKKEGT